MITEYKPNRCSYKMMELRKHIYLYASSQLQISIDNGQASASCISGDAISLVGTEITFSENASYNDHFKFEKEVTLKVNGYKTMKDLNEKYYVILEDKDDNYWLVNYDFPSYVTYEYTLNEEDNETAFQFSIQSNFPTLKLNINITPPSFQCNDYETNGVKRLRLIEREDVIYSLSGDTIYVSSGNTFYDVDANEGSVALKETFDGLRYDTSLSFNINMDDYLPSWHYNLMEYQNNRYFAIVTSKNGNEYICGTENGLVPSYNINGKTITVTLDETSNIGTKEAGYISETSNAHWLIIETNPQYIWKLTDDWVCEESD